MSEEIRLNKYLAEAGICSRREADRLIEAGKIKVNGVVASMGVRVSTDDVIEYGKKIISGATQASTTPILLAYNKPRGIVCTAEKREKNNIIDHIKYPVRVYNIGRLDKDSRGLILLTNQGDLVNKIMKGSNYHEKEYVVRTDKEITADFVKNMSAGMYLKDLNETARPCVVKKLSKYTFSIILTQGLNRQIRRMCETLGYRVTDLRRIRVMNIELGDLKEDELREVTAEEQAKLLTLLEGSKNNYGRI